ncbi:hypothetical protein N7454_008543 [Penicillium verhagenii]|nr:hypothetical protein N7454_008543 [Penicillium verhagenii]
MSGEKNLSTLLSTMQPVLDPETYVFVTTTKALPSLPLSTLNPQLIAQEAEGTTIVTTEALAASHGFKETVFLCRKISLTIHSSLEAVGLIAAITDRLKDHEISTNVVSGFFHDHIYVPAGRADDAMSVLGGVCAGCEGDMIQIGLRLYLGPCT